MTTETMTIHRALAELKVLDERIDKLIRESSFCVADRKSAQKLKGVSVEDYKRNAQSQLDKINDLIARQSAIKQAISESNAKTYITVSGTEYTIAMAIWMNQHGMDFREKLLAVMERQYSNAISTIELANASLAKRADDTISRTVSGSDKSNIDAEMLAKMRQNYIDCETMVLFDGIEIKQKCETLADKIGKFKAEVDAALSTSNAVTEITISY